MPSNSCTTYAKHHSKVHVRYISVNSPLAADAGGDSVDALVHDLQAGLLVQRHAGHHVHGRGDQLDAHGAVGGAYCE
jgi:hypothetical protein